LGGVVCFVLFVWYLLIVGAWCCFFVCSVCFFLFALFPWLVRICLVFCSPFFVVDKPMPFGMRTIDNEKQEEDNSFYCLSFQKQEVRVRSGAKLPLVGFHNTYGVNFAIHPDKATLREGLTVIVKPPRIDPELEKMHEKLSKLQEEFFKAMNNEKEFLRTRAAATRLAVQPGVFGLNPEIINRLVRSFY
jgi:hypothetical protein